jgi:hypothetical protein
MTIDTDRRAHSHARQLPTSPTVCHMKLSRAGDMSSNLDPVFVRSDAPARPVVIAMNCRLPIGMVLRSRHRERQRRDPGEGCSRFVWIASSLRSLAMTNSCAIQAGSAATLSLKNSTRQGDARSRSNAFSSVSRFSQPFADGSSAVRHSRRLNLRSETYS